MREPEKTVLILGGTAEAADMAARLHRHGVAVTTSLAGRTRDPGPLAGAVRTGGFGGADGLARYLSDNAIALLVDMTHPFATRMSANARQAAAMSGVPLVALQRAAWIRQEDDRWLEVQDIAAAVTAIPRRARVLLALGSQHIAPFSARSDVHFLVRMIDPPAEPLPLAQHELLLARPGPVEAEHALLQHHGITHIVCRNSGGKASYAKIAAARLLSLPVIMITRQTSGESAPEQLEQQILSALA